MSDTPSLLAAAQHGSRPSAPAPRSHPARHPVVLRLDAERAANVQLRLADRITAFAGSMPFVYLHAVAFVSWMLFGERSPWPTLTLAVSLEAIFLSAFVMIGQNRQAAFQQAKADHDFREQEQELKANTELTRAIHQLTIELHEHVLGAALPEADARDRASSAATGTADAGPLTAVDARR